MAINEKFMKCSQCGEDYTGISSDSSLSPCCFKSLVGPVSSAETYRDYTATNISPTCHKCGKTLNIQCVYVNDKIFCSDCFTQNNGIWKPWECIRCNKINAPFVKYCDCKKE